MNEPSVEEQINEILEHFYRETESSEQFIGENATDHAIESILALFSTQQAQMREEIKGLYKYELNDEDEIEASYMGEYYKVTDVLNILGEPSKEIPLFEGTMEALDKLTIKETK